MINLHQDKITLSVAEAVKKVLAPDLKLSEGKMKELDALIKKGVTDPKKIAKELGLPNDPKTLAAIAKLAEASIDPADQAMHDLHSVDVKDDPEQEKQTEDAETDAEDAIDDNEKELEKTAPEQMKTEAKLAEYDFEEGNEFTAAAAKAKLAGEDEFEFDGKTYPTEISQDAAEKILGKKEAIKEALSKNDKTAGYAGRGQFELKRHIMPLVDKNRSLKDVYFDGPDLVGDTKSGKQPTIAKGVLTDKKMTVGDLEKIIKNFKG